MDVSIGYGTGNSFILKPSEKDPASMFIVELFNKTKAQGLLNLLNGGKEVVNELIDDERIKL